jgi:NAD(P)-dependent dehydrogenase (short-subunit alcohol dehydrogenase family)
MDLQLKDKTALVTGSTAGIGLAIARALAAEGARVVINGRTQARVEAALQELDGTARGIAADLATEAGREALFASLPQVDVLVNNLGIFEAKELAAVAPDDWERLFNVNVVSGAKITQHYLPAMLARNAGRVLFIASEAGVNIPPDMIPYGVSKAAQIALARGFAETTAGTGVTVNTLLPGPTRSEGIETFLASLPLEPGQSREALEREFLAKLRPTSLIKRFASVD